MVRGVGAVHDEGAAASLAPTRHTPPPPQEHGDARTVSRLFDRARRRVRWPAVAPSSSSEKHVARALPLHARPILAAQPRLVALLRRLLAMEASARPTAEELDAWRTVVRAAWRAKLLNMCEREMRGQKKLPFRWDA